MKSEPPKPDTPTPKRPSLIARLGTSLEAEVVIALALLAGLLLAFVLIAGLVTYGATGPLDERIMLVFRTPQDLSDPIGPKWFEEAVRDVTALGSTTVLSLLIICVTTFLALTRRARIALTVLACTLSGTAMSSLAKLAFARPRPELVPHSVEVYTASFPSGHALMSAVVYLTLSVLVARTQPDRRVKLFIMIFAVAITLLVGLSRIYLGVHWPTDVLAGWCLGAVWATLCWLFARHILEPQ
jgi:undecaprenyl-diphosphatase